MCYGFAIVDIHAEQKVMSEKREKFKNLLWELKKYRLQDAIPTDTILSLSQRN